LTLSSIERASSSLEADTYLPSVRTQR
jgi:hypothetical protein